MERYLICVKKFKYSVVPKSQFPGLLKSTTDALQSKNTNLVAEFATCGMVNLDCTRVFKKLPDYIDSSMDCSATSWSSSIIDVVKTVRCPELKERARVRGENINVEPDKSVGAGDSDSKSSNEEVDGTVVQSPPTATNGYVSISSPPPINFTSNNEIASNIKLMNLL